MPPLLSGVAARGLRLRARLDALALGARASRPTHHATHRGGLRAPGRHQRVARGTPGRGASGPLASEDSGAYGGAALLRTVGERASFAELVLAHARPFGQRPVLPLRRE